MVNRKFGIEIEFKGISRQKAKRVLGLVGITADIQGHNHTTRQAWKLVTDGSVSNGYELVSPVLEGEEDLKAAVKAVTALDDAGGRVDKQTGIHVHFDASNLTPAHIKTMIQRYARFEIEIDRFMPSSRRGNNNQYTKSIRTIATGLNFTNAQTVAAMSAAMGNRYLKVNLQAYRRQRTIEFRQHSGSLNGRKIEHWVRFLYEFIEASIRPPLIETNSPIVDMVALTGKYRTIAELIGRGTTISELMTATGWQAHTVRAAISRQLRRQAGMQIASSRHDGQAFYRLIGQTEQDSLWRGINAETAEFYRNRAAVLSVA